MLFRRQGLIPAMRPQAALSFEQQHAEVRRGGFADLEAAGLGGEVRTGGRGAGDQGRDGPLRRPDRAEQGRPHGAGRQRGRGDRAERLRQVDAVQRHHRRWCEADEGSIRFHGEEIIGLPPHEILEKGIARTFQNLRLFANLTVMENVLIGQHARLKTGVLRAILRPPGTRRGGEAARANGRWRSSRSSATG